MAGGVGGMLTRNAPQVRIRDNNCIGLLPPPSVYTWKLMLHSQNGCRQLYLHLVFVANSTCGGHLDALHAPIHKARWREALNLADAERPSFKGYSPIAASICQSSKKRQTRESQILHADQRRVSTWRASRRESNSGAVRVVDVVKLETCSITSAKAILSTW